MNKTLRKFGKNAKALSPVVASIILIAVTVAVSVVVAAWMGGMSIGLMGNAEQATITNIDFSGGLEIVATVQNTGNAPVTITAGYLEGAAVGTVPVSPDAVATIAPGATQSFTLTASAIYLQGTQANVKLTTSKGNNLVLSAFAPP